VIADWRRLAGPSRSVQRRPWSPEGPERAAKGCDQRWRRSSRRTTM
jgi:hypothetical protein